jgi:hypothetical protein
LPALRTPLVAPSIVPLTVAVPCSLAGFARFSNAGGASRDVPLMLPLGVPLAVAGGSTGSARPARRTAASIVVIGACTVVRVWRSEPLDDAA